MYIACCKLVCEVLRTEKTCCNLNFMGKKTGQVFNRKQEIRILVILQRIIKNTCKISLFKLCVLLLRAYHCFIF